MSDVIIIGSGPAGLSLACSLADLGLEVIVIEKNSQTTIASPAYDGREIALTHLSKSLLGKLNVWRHIPDNAISLVKQAKVLDGNSSYAMHFDYREVCDDTLGYMVSNHQIRKALYDEAGSRDNINFLCESEVTEIETTATNASVQLADGARLHAPLIVAADSRFSASRRNMGISTNMHDFGKVAIVCKVNHELPHRDTAYECFRYGGTLALLPLPGNTSSVVITVTSDKAAYILNQTPVSFGADVCSQFNNRFGTMELVGQRFSYPLVATYASRFVGIRFALIGDAAVGMHPVTAHGFNLGLKGQAILTNQVKNALAKDQDIANHYALAQYNAKFRRASNPLYHATNAIVRLYTDDRLVSRFMRKAALHLGNHIMPVKKTIMHHLTEVKNLT